MTTVALVLVLAPVVVTAYAYAIYPLLLVLRVVLRDAAPAGPVGAEFPNVTIVVPAYNEETQIRGAIEALLAQDYPADRRQILILSDASTDHTDDIVREYASRGVELLRLPERGGKTAAENAAMSRITGTIVINSDASIRLAPSAVSRMVAQFADPTVGVASSRDVSISRANVASNVTEAGYVGYEMWVRDLETRAHGIVGASGSGYAIRAELHRIPVRKDLSRDFSAALTAHRHGYRAVSVREAVCYVPRTASLKAEYRRKVRTISRGMETLLFNRDLLDLQQHGLFAWKLLSHKVARWLTPLLLLPGIVGLALLAAAYPIAAVLLGGSLALTAIAIVGALWPDGRPRPRPLALLTFAAAANLAVVHAAWRVFHGHEDHLWEPTRRVSESSEPKQMPKATH